MSASIVHPTRRPLPALLVYGAAVVLVSVVGGLASNAGMGLDGWYADADKPWFTPPGAVFGIVWTALYAAIAVAAWRLSRVRARSTGARARSASAALRLWWVQLALNLAWTPLFFAAQWLVAGLVDILLLDVAVALLTVRAWRLERFAGLLLAPYLVWALFATALTIGFVVLN